MEYLISTPIPGVNADLFAPALAFRAVAFFGEVSENCSGMSS